LPVLRLRDVRELHNVAKHAGRAFQSTGK
jgi:hypothetical protein